MATGQTLRGLVGQGMDGRKASSQGYAYQYPPGSYSFSPPAAGFWKFVLWGPGGASAVNGAGSGAYCEYTRFLGPSDAVAIVVSDYAAPTTATFPGGKVVSAGNGSDAGAAATGGVATGGDVNLNGTAGGTGAVVAGTALGTGGGASGTGLQGGGGAPANLPFRGGRGGDTGAATRGTDATSPGGGGGSSGSVLSGGTGLAIVMFVRP